MCVEGRACGVKHAQLTSTWYCLMHVYKATPQQLLSHLRHIEFVRISIRRKGLSSCWGLALYPTLAFTSEQASSTESVDRERGQKLLSCSSSALCRYQYCTRQLPLAEHAANNLAETPLTEVGKGSMLKMRSPKTCIRFRSEVLLLRDMLH